MAERNFTVNSNVHRSFPRIALSQTVMKNINAREKNCRYQNNRSDHTELFRMLKLNTNPIKME